MAYLTPLVCFLALLRCCTFQDLTCTVSRETNGQTTYIIPDSAQSKCDYSWANAEDVVLATQEKETDGNVLDKNKTTLILRTSINTVFYTRVCVPEGIKQTATCNATCTGPAEPLTTEPVTTKPVTKNGPVIDFLRSLCPHLKPGLTAMKYSPTPGRLEDVGSLNGHCV